MNVLKDELPSPNHKNYLITLLLTKLIENLNHKNNQFLEAITLLLEIILPLKWTTVEVCRVSSIPGNLTLQFIVRTEL